MNGPVQRPAGSAPMSNGQMRPAAAAAAMGPNGPQQTRPGPVLPNGMQSQQPPQRMQQGGPTQQQQQQQRMSGGPGALKPSPNPTQQQFLSQSPPTANGSSPSPSPNTNTSQSTADSNSTDSDEVAQLRQQLERLSQEYRAYKRTSQEELSEAKRQRLTLQNSLNELQSKYTDSTRQLSESTSRINELQSALQKSRAAAETELNFFNLEVEKEIARSKQDKEKIKLQQTLASYEDAHKKNKKIIETLNGEIVKLKQAYKSVVNGTGGASNPSIAGAMNSGLASTTGGITNHTINVAAQEEIARLKAELAKVAPNPQPNNSSAVSVGALQNQLAAQEESFTAQLDEWKLKYDQLSKTLEETRTHAISTARADADRDTTAATELTAELESAHSKITSLTQELKSSQSRWMELETKLTGVQSQLSSAQKELSIYHHQTNQAPDESQKHHIEELTQKIAELETKVKQVEMEKEQAIDDMQSTLRESEEKFAKLSHQYDATRQSLHQSQESASKLKSDLSTLSSTHTATLQDVARLTSESTTAKASLAASITNMAEMREQFTKASLLHEEQLKEKWNQIAALQKENETLKMTTEGLKASHQTQLSQLQSSLTSTQHELTTARQLAKEQSTKHEAIIETLRKENQIQITQHQAAVATLRQEHDAKSTELTTLISTLRDELSQLKEALSNEKLRATTEIELLQSALTSERAQLKKTISDHQAEVNDLNTQLQQQHQLLETTRNDHESYVTAKEKSLTELQAHLSATQSQLDELTRQHSDLSTSTSIEIANLTQQLERMEKRCLDLQVQLKDKKSALAAYHEQIEYNSKRRAELAAQRATTPQKKSLLGSIVKKLHLDDSPSTADDDTLTSVDMFHTDPNSNGLSKDQQNELAEEVAISLTKRLQQSESEKIKLEQEVNQREIHTHVYLNPINVDYETSARTRHSLSSPSFHSLPLHTSLLLLPFQLLRLRGADPFGPRLDQAARLQARRR